MAAPSRRAVAARSQRGRTRLLYRPDVLVRVFGPLRVEADDGTPLAALRPMERRLVAALTARRPQPVGVDDLADALWPDGPPTSARKTIQTNVLRVRAALGADAVETVDGGYRLASNIGVDVDRFEAAMRDDAWDDALRWVAGTPFADIVGWAPAEPARVRLEELGYVAEEGRLAALLEIGADVVADLEALVAASPLREGAWCLLVRALRDTDRRVAALRAYERARQTFIAELGTSPGPELAALYESLVDDPGDVRRRAEDALAAAGDGLVTNMDAADPVIAHLEDAAALVPPGPTPLRARLLSRLAVVRSHHRPMAESEERAAAALAIARVLDHRPDVLAEALLARAVVVDDPARRGQRRAAVSELLSLANEHDRPAWRQWVLPLVARGAALDGDLEGAGAALDEMGGAEAELLRASVRGDWDAARAAVARIRKEDELRHFDPNAAALREFGALGIVALLEGTGVAGPRPVIEWPLPSLGWSVDAWHADALARQGDLDTARAELDAIDLAGLASFDRDGYWLATMSMFADAAFLARCPAVAEAVGELMEPYIDLTIFDPGCLYRGAASHTAGLAAATCGRSARAEELLVDALATHERHESPWMVVRSNDALATARG